MPLLTTTGELPKLIPMSETAHAIPLSMVQAIDLTKRYGDFLAVDRVSFDVRAGEIFGFLGPNGAGKTSTINMLIGMARIDGGKVIYQGENLSKSIKKAQGFIGVVCDESNLYEDLSGYDNLCFCGALYGLSKTIRQKRASELLDAFRLKDAADKVFRAYSKGMKRKLTIAAALIHDPKLLYLDEPTTGIDIESARQIRSLLRELNQKSMTIFLTTHYIEEAERLCDRVAFIAKGRITALGTVEKLIADLEEKAVVEFAFDPNEDGEALEKAIKGEFMDSECFLSAPGILRITSESRLDIAPLVSFVSGKRVPVYEAKLIRPSLEDAFVAHAGIGIDALKKEKEKK